MTPRPPFVAQLTRRWDDADTLLCVGLDPDPARLPAGLTGPDGLLEFCIAIVDATADLVCAFKPQIAYFAALAAEAQLTRLIEHIHRQHPGVPVILDAKRGDIGDTARRYAVEAFERYDADAVTVNPYLGRESVEPFLAYADRGVFLLCRTSNPDSAWLQDYPADAPAFLRVAEAARRWDRHGNLMLVAGATYADDLRRIREIAGPVPLLVPGIGAQGGDLAEVLAVGLDDRGHGLVINAARSVLYADAGAAFADAARTSARDLRDAIRSGRDRLRTGVGS
ncbi:MAG: orotidine-5'-phosphate decarboxylase [Pseudomonadales bacterium]